MTLAVEIKERAGELGFGLVGVASVGASEHMGAYRAWIGDGAHGDMSYLSREDALARRADLGKTLPSVRSAVVVGHAYDQRDPPGVPDDPARGVVARYARGRDYHTVIKKRLRKLHRWIESRTGGPVPGRAYVDTGPILERELAMRAGLGWFGKNTMLIHPRRGSYFFLGILLLDMELEADAPFAADHCGRCRSCLDACPTGALLGRDANGAPVMDARRCISYLTIEHRGAIPTELRPLMGNRVYGCDICQEVCPFTRKFSEPASEPGYAARGPGEAPMGVEAMGRRRDAAPDAVVEQVAHPGTDGPRLVDLMRMDEAAWDAFSRGSAIRRAGYAGFRRNVTVALGNWLACSERPDPEAVGLLVEALSDPDGIVSEHAAWALRQKVGGD